MMVESRFTFNIFLCAGMCVLYVNGKTACSMERSQNKDDILLLECKTNQMIHVMSKRVGRRDTSSNSCRVSRTSSNCGEHRITSINSTARLHVRCNGEASCKEHTNTSTSSSKCPEGISYPAVEIEYKCIQGSVDICSGHTMTKGRDVYLHTAGFPLGDEIFDHCTCTVSGTNMKMKVELLQYWQKYGDFFIQDDTGVVWPTHKYVTIAFNTPIRVNNNSDLTIKYNKTGIQRFGTWIRITNAKKIVCTNATFPSSSPGTRVPTSLSVDHTDSTLPMVDATSSTVSPSPKTSKTSTSPVQATTKEELFIVLITTTSTASVVVVVLISIVIFLLCRRHRKGKREHTVKEFGVTEKDAHPIPDYLHRPVNNCGIDLAHSSGDDPNKSASGNTSMYDHLDTWKDGNQSAASPTVLGERTFDRSHMIDNDIYDGGPAYDVTA